MTEPNHLHVKSDRYDGDSPFTKGNNNHDDSPFDCFFAISQGEPFRTTVKAFRDLVQTEHHS
jgi:hypothetical protein